MAALRFLLTYFLRRCLRAERLAIISFGAAIATGVDVGDGDDARVVAASAVADGVISVPIALILSRLPVGPSRGKSRKLEPPKAMGCAWPAMNHRPFVGRKTAYSAWPTPS